METSRNFEQNIEVESDKEVRQITHRDYKAYMQAFNLPESSLAKIKTVVDVGAGFSTFSKEVREKFNKLKTIAVDPIYKILRNDLYKSIEELERREKVYLDFAPSYRGEEILEDSALIRQKEKQFFWEFITEVEQHPNDYISASHQKLPLADESADLVLASNSIIRSENKPQVIKKALQECIRILEGNGEVRIAGAITCFAFNTTTNNVELWYTRTRNPGGSWVEEFKQTGHFSDPELMEVFKDLEISGIKLYCVLESASINEEKHGRFDTLILRKDDKRPVIEESNSKDFKVELRKLDFQKTDGFNIPTVQL